ncbi:hypothetical protein LAV_00108 [Sphingobium phage Lacusarx]|uniref:Uncharacterized protein n=1 Tax=Sphingobium phage Lacusarx TaxID=1980139 RepID=A0A1W6DX50_9CAUD|nr:hypothetical protein FDH44_gp194 [Sphingobium phage Lacusarx]ARK07484.1 hypothetical protein LAV_00108 [Sphingobium phage Lacusarx]
MATIFAKDDLIVDATASLNGRVAEIGGSWVSVSGTSSGLGGTSGTMGVYLNQGARSTSTTSPGVIAYLSDPAPADDIVLSWKSGYFGTSGAPGVAFRVNGTSGYLLQLAQTFIVLYKTVAGSRKTVIQQTGLSPLSPTNAFHDYELHVKGGRLSLYKDGALFWEYEDADAPLLTAGNVGLFIRGDGRTTNFLAYVPDGEIVVGSPESAGSSEAAFAGEKFVAGSISSAGTTPTAYMQSATYRVGEMRNANGESNARFDAIALITAQMYALAQAPEPDFHSVGFSATTGAMDGAGTTVAAFVGRATMSGDMAGAGVTSDAMVSRAFGQGEGEFSIGSGGTSAAAFTAQRIVSARMQSEPKYDGDSFKFVGGRTIEASFLSEGSSTAGFTGYVAVRIEAAGSSTASFAPTDVTIPATFSAVGSSVGALKELEFAVTRFGQVGALGFGRMVGVSVTGGAMKSQGASIMSGWAGATIFSSEMGAEGSMRGRMVSLSFSSNIPTPDDRVSFLPAEDRTAVLEVEDREVLLPVEDREILLPAEDRIAYL